MCVPLWRKGQKRHRCAMDVMYPKGGEEEAQDEDFRTECTQGSHFSLAASVYSSVACEKLLFKKVERVLLEHRHTGGLALPQC